MMWRVLLTQWRRGRDFFWPENDGADTFFEEKNDGARTFFSWKMTGQRLFSFSKIKKQPRLVSELLVFMKNIQFLSNMINVIFLFQCILNFRKLWNISLFPLPLIKKKKEGTSFHSLQFVYRIYVGYIGIDKNNKN